MAAAHIHMEVIREIAPPHPPRKKSCMQPCGSTNKNAYFMARAMEYVQCSPQALSAERPPMPFSLDSLCCANKILWCGHRLRPNHAHPLCLNLLLGRTLTWNKQRWTHDLQISFLIPGHIKFDVDRVFSITSKGYTTANVFPTTELATVMSQSPDITAVIDNASRYISVARQAFY